MSLFAITTEESRTAFEFAGLPAGWGRLLALLTLVGLCYAVFWLYRREGRAGASSRVRYAMAVVRCAVVLLLAAIWLEPFSLNLYSCDESFFNVPYTQLKFIPSINSPICR